MDTKFPDGGSSEEESLYGSEEYGSQEEDPGTHAMMNLIERKQLQQDGIPIDWESILEQLGSELPKIPQKPCVEQINPPPYAQPRILFGKLMPKPEDDKKGKKKAAKKAAAKKDGPPPKPVKWEDGPPKYVKNTYHFMQEA